MQGGLLSTNSSSCESARAVPYCYELVLVELVERHRLGRQGVVDKRCCRARAEGARDHLGRRRCHAGGASADVPSARRFVVGFGFSSGRSADRPAACGRGARGRRCSRARGKRATGGKQPLATSDVGFGLSSGRSVDTPAACRLGPDRRHRGARTSGGARTRRGASCAFASSPSGVSGSQRRGLASWLQLRGRRRRRRFRRRHSVGRYGAERARGSHHSSVAGCARGDR